METINPFYPGKTGRVMSTIARYVLGLPLLVFGLNMFFNFIPQPKTEMAPGAVAFSAALMNTGYIMPMIGVTFLIVSVCLLLNRFVPFALALFAPFIVNSILFHAVLEHSGLPMAIVFLALELYLAWSYRSAYRSMLSARVSTG